MQGSVVMNIVNLFVHFVCECLKWTQTAKNDLRDAIKKNRNLLGVCPKFVDPLPSPLIGPKKLGLFAKLFDPLPPSQNWDIMVKKIGFSKAFER